MMRIANYYLSDVGLNEVVQPRRLRSFFKSGVHFAAQSFEKIDDRLGLSFNQRFADQLPATVHYRNGSAFLMHVHAHIIRSHKRAPLWSALTSSHNSKLPPEGCPFIY